MSYGSSSCKHIVSVQALQSSVISDMSITDLIHKTIFFIIWTKTFWKVCHTIWKLGVYGIFTKNNNLPYIKRKASFRWALTPLLYAGCACHFTCIRPELRTGSPQKWKQTHEIRNGGHMLHSLSFTSACLREIQVFRVQERSLDHIKWLFNPNIWAANWAAASGDRTVEHPRPLGILREDQISWAPQSAVRGGQLITGYAVFPERTGPKPLLLPATATNTVGMPSPSYSDLILSVSSGPLWAEVTLSSHGMP